MPIPPSNLELQSLTVLWRLGPSTVSQVWEEMPDGKQRAYTTILTLMQNLEKKGQVRRLKQGKAHIYEAIYPQSKVVGSAVQDLVLNAFGGNWFDAVTTLIKQAKLSNAEKEQVMAAMLSNNPPAKKKSTSSITKTSRTNKSAASMTLDRAAMPKSRKTSSKK